MKKTFATIRVLISVLLLTLLWRNDKKTIAVSPYPDGRNFVFSITDDPDNNRFINLFVP